ncbi:hypothetical protein LY90DRAFT_702018 [Neocallimastix californiae]|jgi:hypothetical protein|uniref:Coth-domain-containing protein n=1 Tax=Neocallimastix californiae TaxID=1754190 RepID=A0A1Y2D7X5_9FUNG|nr:hypothetical protein LY90DRAFT_702018 [Neocallimastix californiae]|eukprot:ORY55361.1 hypothetical protein LY90DRAFT_702018 [Neocallimastix californiae]
MITRYILLLALLIGVAYSKRTVTFKVIAFGGIVQVNILKVKRYNIKPNNIEDPLFTGKISCPDGEFEYNYVVDGIEEPFVRKMTANATSTFNEFYGRKETVKPLGQFQYPDNHWNRSIGKTSLFDDSYIPTIHISGVKTENFFHNPRTSIKAERVTIYLKDSKKSFTNVPLSAKNKDFEKFQIKMSLSRNANIKGRYLLKFRNGSEDPTNLRQTIYGNINQAIGIPSIHSVMVRVYYNKKPAGFYTMQEEAVSESFIRAEFYGDSETQLIDAPEPVGDTFDCSTGADFEYHPANMSFYDPIALKIGKDKKKVIALTKAIAELDPSNEAELEEFDQKWFDIETFHKAMCMEYLTGDWDGYWYFTSNFAIYEDPKQSTDSTYKFYFITQDHDETFGIGLTDTVNTVGYDFPKQSYTTMLNKTWHGDEFDAFRRTLVDKFISSTPQLQKRFQDTLISIVQNIFNPVAFKKVVDTYYERYRPEVEWDYSFIRPYRRLRQTPDWRYKDFLVAFENPLQGVPWGLYEWVTLRAEAIKKEFCITWEGDANPPESDCVPYKIPGIDKEKENGNENEVETTITEIETSTEYSTETISVTATTEAIPMTTTVVESTATSTTTPTTKHTKTLPTQRGKFSNWFKNKKPSDLKKTTPKVKRAPQQLPLKNYF